MSAPQNFRDPLGLAGRMLRDANPTARRALLRAALGVGLVPLDRVWARSEAARLAAAPADDATPLLLVVGAPRSGTTFVAQTLVHGLDVSFPSNLGAAFPHAPITAQLRLGRPPARSGLGRRSYYGQTPGWHDHNDAFHLWDRWLGAERYRPTVGLDATATAGLRRFVAAWHHAFGRPLVSKNNRNTAVVPELAGALPSARFLVVERARDEVHASLRRARALVHGDVRRAWGLHARDASDAADVDRAIGEQLDRIDADLTAARAAVPTARLLHVDFAAVRADPGPLLDQVAAMLGTTPRP